MCLLGRCVVNIPSDMFAPTRELGRLVYGPNSHASANMHVLRTYAGLLVPVPDQHDINLHQWKQAGAGG